MANPLYNQHGNNPANQIMAQVNQFRQNFKGDPRELVQSMLNDGRMSQQQFNQLAQQANQIMAMMPK